MIRLRPNQTVLAAATFVVAGLLAALIAWGAALVIENRSAEAITSRLLTEGYAWAQVSSDGLRVTLSGTAPNEAARFRAINLAGTIVESSRLVDSFEVTPARTVEAPRFSVEMLRNEDGIQLIGLLPEGTAEAALMEQAQSLTPGADLADMLETSAYPAPDTWDSAFAFGLRALKLLPRSKISVAADAVNITAIASSEAQKRAFEAELAQNRPAGVKVSVDISAPRPVLTPFTLRFVIDGQGPRFDACSADSPEAQARILAVAGAAGITGRPNCTIGLGVPTPSWADAVSSGIAAAATLGSATITFSDADVTLLAGEEVSQASFDRVVGELRNALPDVFSLDATLTKAKTAVTAGPVEFTANMAPDTGRVELRGRLTDDRLQLAVESYAKARFGVDDVYVATRLDPELPDGWPVRVLAGLQALAELDSGSLLVRSDTVEVAGLTGSQLARARVSQILSGELGQGQTFKVDVKYVEALDPLAALPTPRECADRLDDVMRMGKIAFEPGSAEIDSSANAVMNGLAVALTDCSGLQMEIAGHTDAQGSDTGNLALSQARAEAVMLALQGRRVDVSAMRANGYGEGRPVADNGDEAGREANRRIEFTLIGADDMPVRKPDITQFLTPADPAPADAGPALAIPLTSDTPRPKARTPDPAAASMPPETAAQDDAPLETDAPLAAGEPFTQAKEAPDFTGDTSPSLSLTEPTGRPQPRPATDG